MKLLLLLLCGIASPAWAQMTFDGISPAQRADYRKLMFGYRDTFRVLGRAKVCGFKADPGPFFTEVANRHGQGSEPDLIAQMSYASGAQNVMLDRDLDPTPAPPIPCDVLQYMRDIRLPDVPASLQK